MMLAKHLRLVALLAPFAALPALAQDEELLIGGEDAPAAAVEEAPVELEVAPAAETAVEEEAAPAPTAAAPKPAPAPAPAAQPAPPKPKPQAPAIAPKVEAAAGVEAATGSSGGVSETGSGDVASDSASAAESTEGTRGRFDLLSEGARLELKGGDFSIEPPKGWEVYTQQPGLTLFTQPPHDEKFKYQRSIQVAAFDGPRYMDDLTGKEFEEQIPLKFAASSPMISDYKVRSHMPVEMADSRHGLLFYTELKMQDVPLMQAHILVSSDKNHYLLTFTDVASHFEDESESQFLTEAWAAMTSVQLKGRTPVPYQSTAMLGGGVAGVLALCSLIWFVRNYRAKKAYEMYGSGRGLDDVDVKTGNESRILNKGGAPASSGVSGMTFVGDEDDKRS